MAIRWMKVADLVNLPSIDSQESGPLTSFFHDVMPYKIRDIETGFSPKYNVKYYELLREALKHHPETVPPVHVCRGYVAEQEYEMTIDPSQRNKNVLGNGGHRLALAFMANIKKIRVTDDARLTGDDYK